MRLWKANEQIRNDFLNCCIKLCLSGFVQSKLPCSPGVSETKMAATATVVTNTLDSRSRRTLNQRLEDTTMKNACVFSS